MASARIHQLTCLVIAAAGAVVGRADEVRWWPVQTLPHAVVRTENWQRFPAPHQAHHALMQSVAGLAAKAVNENRADELVWIGTGNADLEDWYQRFLNRWPSVEQRGTWSCWDLVDRYVRNGVIKGYILYAEDKSAGELYRRRPDIDRSINVATSLAGLLDGVVVEERLEAQAQSHGLKCLADARGKTAAWCFETYKDRFNRRMLAVQDPHAVCIRDLAIAHNVLTLDGTDDLLPLAMAWLEPLSPILGWIGGDEFKGTRLATVHGHFQTASDWCMNLPVLMAGTHAQSAVRLPQCDPRTIDFQDRRSAVSFVSTDGDNVQWLECNFFRQNSSYWGSPDRGRIPFGWSACLGHLSQLCPEAIDYARETRSANDALIEWGGGYYYPDLFAAERPQRWELLGRCFARTWAVMKSQGVRIVGFCVSRHDSPDALTAYQVLAQQTEGLLAILIFQYAPYEGGAGKTYWVKDRKGVEIPVITARYSIWEHANRRPRSGTPAKVAREIRDTVSATPPAELPRYDWISDHVWSHFRHAPGPDEEAENLPKQSKSDKKSASEEGGLRGYTPVVWCAERLPDTIRVVTPEELAWRIRMKHNPEQTNQLIRTWQER